MLTTYGQIQRMSCETAKPSVREWGFYQRVANRIVEQAAEDYQKALCSRPTYTTIRVEHQIEELERFFLSDWFMVLTDLDGAKLMNRLTEECALYEYNYAKVRKAHGQYREEDEYDLVD